MNKSLFPLTTTGLLLFGSPLVDAQEAQKPNIIVVFCDDLGYGDLGCFGSTKNRTPNLDFLANQGIRFTDCYAAASISSPSRLALLTGRYPTRGGITRVLNVNDVLGIKSSDITIPEMLKSGGYYSGIVGKWHLGNKTEFLPLQNGFDEYYGIPYSNDMSPLVYMKGNSVDSTIISQEYITKTYTKKAIEFIENNKTKPFFLYLAHTMPHVPIFASPQFKGKSANGLYGDVIEELDWSVGEIMNKLRDTGLEENTIIVFSSDNGPWLKQANSGTSFPCFQGKFTTWEGGHRVPTIAYWKGKTVPKISTEMTTLMDWFPTFATIAGVRVPNDRMIDGIDISPILFNTGSRGKEEFYYFDASNIRACRVGDFKLKLPTGEYVGNANMATVPAHDSLLFNLRNNIGETTNLLASNRELVSQLKTKINNFNSLKREQSIVMDATITKLITDVDFSPATTNSYLPITYSVVNQSVAKVTTAGLIDIVGEGTTQISASQSGNSIFYGATTKTMTLHVLNSTGIAEIENDYFQLFPNPAKSSVSIHSESNFTNISIYNAVGKNVFNLSTNDRKIVIPTTKIGNTGIYFVKVNGNSKCLAICE